VRLSRAAVSRSLLEREQTHVPCHLVVSLSESHKIMAARSGNIRRGTTPATLPLSSSNLTPSSSNVTTTQIPPTHTKSTISVEEWERKAPLSDLQLRSVTEVMKAAEKLPMPLKVCSCGRCFQRLISWLKIFT